MGCENLDLHGLPETELRRWMDFHQERVASADVAGRLRSYSILRIPAPPLHEFTDRDAEQVAKLKAALEHAKREKDRR